MTTTATDLYGDFTLESKGLLISDTLVFHFVGMHPVEYVVRKKNSEIKIMMEDGITRLGGAIVVGGAQDAGGGE